MKSSEPPGLATWLLEHLVLGNRNEGLAGDLVEEFRQRRSVAWYWRQVLGAIFVSFSNELRAQWVAVGFAIVWTCAVAMSWKHIKTSPQLVFLFFWAIGHDWPKSIIYVMGIDIVTFAAILSVGLSLYLAVVRSFELRRFSRGMLVGLVASVGGVLLPSPGPAHNLYYTLASLKSHWFDYLVAWLPWFGALLLSMWAARPSWARKDADKSSA